MKQMIKMQTSALLLTAVMVLSGLANQTYAQERVVVRVEDKTEVVIQPQSEENVRVLEKYDFNRVIRDIRRNRIELTDGNVMIIEGDDDSKYLKDQKSRRSGYGVRWHFNIDFGINNYLEDGRAPDGSSLYYVRPWGSWYIGLFPMWSTKIAGPLRLQWGGGIDWYNFKYQNHRTRITQTEDGLEFTEDPRTDISPIKSKTSAAYLKARLIPVFDFTQKGRRLNDRVWNENVGRGFRFGVGPYIGYRIDSWTKWTYREGGNKRKERAKGNYHLQNFRYGIRTQVGFRGIDVFFTYDLNKLYVEDKDTPKVNAFAFGITI